MQDRSMTIYTGQNILRKIYQGKIYSDKIYPDNIRQNISEQNILRQNIFQSRRAGIDENNDLLKHWYTVVDEMSVE